MYKFVNMVFRRLQRLWHVPLVRITVWIAISGVLLYLALRDVNLGDVWVSLRQARFGYVLLALASVAVNLFSKAARWQMMLLEGRKRVDFKYTLISLMTGQTLNWFIPGRVGDLSRAYVIGGRGAGRSYVLGTVALEKAIDMVAYGLIFLLTLFMLPLPAWLNESGYTLIIVAGVVLLGVFLLVMYPQWFLGRARWMMVWMPSALQNRLVRILESGLSSLTILRQRVVIYKLAFWSAVVWGTAVLNNTFTALALDIDVPFTASLVVLLVLQAGISVPAVPGKIGVFQYLCILGLGLFAVNQTAGLSFGILLQALVFLPTTLVSLLFMGSLGLGKKELSSMQLPETNEI